jgi:hypothetical protein
MDKHNVILAVYPSQTAAETAAAELQQSGFDMKSLSIVDRACHGDELDTCAWKAGARVKSWGRTGFFWGGLGGLLFSPAFPWTHGLGPLLPGGPLVSRIADAVEGAAVVGGICALAAWRFGPRAPKPTVGSARAGPPTGKFLLIAHGSDEDAGKAREILNHAAPGPLGQHP